MAVARRDPALARVAFWWTFVAIYVCWNATTLAGAVGAQALGNPAKFGLDAVVPAAFLALLAPRLRNGDERSRDASAADTALRSRESPRIAAGAALIALVLIPLTPPGVPVLAAAAAVLLAGRLR
jgi:predicted branched-subunit amino acid permease